jgi:hypothetical protein
MAGFTTSNNNIKVTENVTVGGTTVEETVMDTGSDMPHIVGTTYLANQTVDFSNMGQTQSYAGIDYCSSNSCIGFEWNFVFTPGFYTYELQYVYVPGEWSFERTWSYFGGWSYERVYYPSQFYTEYVLTYVPSTYTREYVTVFDACCWTEYYIYSINARESSSTTNIANLPTDEDGNAIDIDFIIVQATGSRTLAGSDPRFSQTFVTGVAPKTFSFQGSVLLEAAAETNGNSWMRRIMSVFVNNSTGKLQLQQKESIRSINRSGYDSAFATGSTRSTFSFNLKVFFGRFK